MGLQHKQYLKMCLLLRMAGQVSSAKALESTRSSNSFLHGMKTVKQYLIQEGTSFFFLVEITKLCISHTCHCVLELPILHHEKQRNLVLISMNELGQEIKNLNIA